MKRNLGFQQNLLLVLIIAILIVCAGFIFISCGKGPQSKIADPDSGAFALDFSNCSAGSVCRALLGIAVGQDPDKLLANKNLTAEAWVKSKASTTSTFDGAIFGRFADGGIILYVKDGIAKASIRRIGATGTATATADYIVSSGVQIADNAWHHIAAVLTSRDESAVNPDCGTAVATNRTDTVDCTAPGTVCNDGIHLNIYVDGVYKDCNTTFGENNDTSVTQPAFAGEPGLIDGESFISAGVFAENANNAPLDGLANNASLPGIVDEARLWGVARTESQINQCKSKELSLDSGTCGRLTSNCIGYLRLNEGAGATVNDWCGLGTGVLEVASPLSSWTTGWTTNTPNLTKAD